MVKEDARDFDLSGKFSCIFSMVCSSFWNLSSDDFYAKSHCLFLTVLMPPLKKVDTKILAFIN